MFRCSNKTCRKEIVIRGYCPECRLSYSRKWNAAHPGYATQKRKEWALRNPERAREIDLAKREKGKAARLLKPDRVPLTLKERKQRYFERYPIKAEARKIYKYALRMGRLVKQPCEVCGDLEVDGHHEDYMKPLEVIWLCKAHHREAHKKS